MKISALLNLLCEDIENSSPDDLHHSLELIDMAQNLSSTEKETLACLFNNGPVYDGDVPSKGARDSLIQKGLAVKVVSKGQDGFQACTYKGRWIHKIVLAESQPLHQIDPFAWMRNWLIAYDHANNFKNDTYRVSDRVMEWVLTQPMQQG